MTWIKLDDKIRSSPKHLKAGPDACWLWVCGLSYANDHKTDGFIPDEALPTLGAFRAVRRLAEQLVQARRRPEGPGLWVRDDIRGGYVIHDYHDFQPSAEEATDLSEVRAAAGAAGGKRSGEVRRAKAHVKQGASSKTEASTKQVASQSPGRETQSTPIPSDFDAQSTQNANANPVQVGAVPEEHHHVSHGNHREQPKQVASQLLEANANPVPTRPDPSPPPSLRSGGTRARGRPKRPIPDDWAPGEPERAYARTRGLTDPEIQAQAEEFTDHYIAAQTPWADWLRVWQRWVRRYVRERDGNGATASPARLPPLSDPDMERVVKVEFGFAEGLQPKWRFTPRAAWEYARQAAREGADRGAIVKILNERIDSGWDWRTYQHSVR